MNLNRGYRAHSKTKVREARARARIQLNSDCVLIIKLPDSRILRIISRSLFLAIFILTLPLISSILRDASSGNKVTEEYSSAGLARPYDLIQFESLPLVFKDLVDEGLLKNGHKALLLSSGIGDLLDHLWFLNEEGIDLVIDSDLERQMVIPDEAFDFVFASGIRGTEFINRVVKSDGIVVMPLGNLYDTSYEFLKLSNYKIVYLRRFNSNTVLATRKMRSVANSPKTRRLCGVTNEAKIEALISLEAALLEPPSLAQVKQSNSEEIKYLSELLGVLFDSYKRRIFITDEKDGVVDWFYKNYPKRDRLFEVYDLENEIDIEEKVSDREIGVSEWLLKNVREDDYVVMKAEAGLVEEMMKEKTVCLLDELFLECNNQRKKKTRKRAYWQCVELYGKLRDEGVAVHHWWG